VLFPTCIGRMVVEMVKVCVALIIWDKMQRYVIYSKEKEQVISPQHSR
jgi:hypothetical protein